MTQKAITFEIKLERPALITKPGAGEENSSESYSYIPGSVIRGLFISKFLRETGFDANQLARADKTRNLFFDGGVRFLNAYVVDEQGNRLLPKPLSWQVDKDELTNKEAEISDFGIKIDPSIKSPKSPLGEFAWIENKEYFIYKPNQFDRVHNASEERMEKKAGTSFVFRYQTIPAGTILKGVLVGDFIEELRDSLNWNSSFPAFVGGSRSAGYGKCTVSTPVYHDSSEGWDEYQTSLNKAPHLVVTLLSDTILLNENGQFSNNLDEIFNTPHLKDFSYVKSTIVGGFNSKWGLPIPQSLAIKAGSVFAYDRSKIVIEKFNTLVEGGIGQRTIDGFGRLAIDWQGDSKLDPRNHLERENQINLAKYEEKSVTLSPESRQIAELMIDRIIRSTLDARLAKVLSTMGLINKISNSQLARLRVVCQQVINQKDLSLFGKHVNMLKATSEQIENCKVECYIDHRKEKIRLPYFLKVMCNDVKGFKKFYPDDDDLKQDKDVIGSVWTKMIWTSDLYIPKIGNVAFDDDLIRDKYQVEYIARLLQALFKKEIRSNQAQEGGK